MKMRLALTVTAILFFVFVSPARAHRYTKGQNESTSAHCKHSAPVEKFAASFYTALIVTQDPGVVRGLQLPGSKAADLLYPIIADLLERKGLCDADVVAWTASRAVALADTIELPTYIQRVADDIGQFLEQKGMLDCGSAVPLALDFFKFVRQELGRLDDGGTFEFYMKGIVEGLVEFLHAHDLDLKVVAQPLADLFYSEFSSNKKCKVSKAS